MPAVAGCQVRRIFGLGLWGDKTVVGASGPGAPWPDPQVLARRAASDAASGVFAAPQGPWTPSHPGEDALVTPQDPETRMFLPHEEGGLGVARVPPRSDAALCCAAFKGQAGLEIAAIPPRPAPLWNGAV